MRISEASIKQLAKAEETGSDQYIFDDEIRGFYAKRNKGSGTISFGIQYKRDGRNRRYHIGRYPTLRFGEAEKEARKLAAQVELGGDPAGRRQERRQAPTVTELCECFVNDYARPHLRPLTVKRYESLLDLHILPAVGTRKIGDIERADVVRLHQKMKDKPVTANRAVMLISKLCNYAESLGWRQLNSNPTTRIPKYKEKPRDRYLTPAELAHLGVALKEHEERHRDVVLLARLLLLTGCRRMEIQGLRWENVRTDLIHIRDAKTGDRVVHLSPSARVLLHEAREWSTSEWVIPGRVQGKPMNNPHNPWRRITEAAGLEGLRFHDLRHTLASVGVAGGMSLPLIGAVLGHSSQGATARYAHLADDPVKEAAEKVAESVWSKLEAVPLVAKEK